MSQNKAKRCAARLLSLTPRFMQTLRVEMRAGRPPELTVPQFRSLVFYENHPGGALSDAAEHLGLALPTASKLMDGLVCRGFLTREASAEDRRRAIIALTAEGARVLEVSRAAATAVFTRRFEGLSEVELDILFTMLGMLERVIAGPAPQGEASR